MREVVMAMMTTLNGRVDQPNSWVTGVDDAQYRAIEQQYERFDAIVVGATTYAEMYEYWPGALTDDAGYGGADAGTNQRMARLIRDDTKYVVSRGHTGRELPWEHSELVVTETDADLARFVRELKAEPGGDIHLAGGASLVQDVVRLGLVDRFRLMVYPLISPGQQWFGRTERLPPLELVGVESFANGVVLHEYRVVRQPG